MRFHDFETKAMASWGISLVDLIESMGSWQTRNNKWWSETYTTKEEKEVEGLLLPLTVHVCDCREGHGDFELKLHIPVGDQRLGKRNGALNPRLESCWQIFGCFFRLLIFYHWHAMSAQMRSAFRRCVDVWLMSDCDLNDITSPLFTCSTKSIQRVIGGSSLVFN